ncbi:outer membrane lipoprotein carrier protein LolA [Actinoplanes sp. GCM10030250]|uniref:LolA family protein n=1 Tax=Actinoplanes sp. GCM10030250 TaxID=3273376 RepID=UPI00360CE1D2
MSVFRSRPALRWLVPSAAAVAVIGGGAAAGTIVANADPALPDRTAAQLLVDLQSADPKGLSGTVVQSSDLGLPGIAGLLGKAGGNVAGNGGGLTSLIAGSNTARVWYAGEDKVRFALVGTDGETDVIRNGQDVWVWQSQDNTGTHAVLPAETQEKPEALPSGIPSTPKEAADAALAAIDPSTQVATTGAAEVAGRDAYELVLSPKNSSSLVGQVRLAIDATEHIPLRVDVYAKNTTKPAFRVAFEQISFTVPDAEQFTFNPPPGAKVDEAGKLFGADGMKPGAVKPDGAKADAAKARAEAQAELHKGLGEKGEPKVIGEGWASIVTAKLPESPEKALAGAEAEGEGAQAQAFLDVMPKVSGEWGSGRLLSGALFSVLLTDDGRVFAGAVTPEALYAVA